MHFGLDIGSSSIKVVSLRKNQGAWKLVAAGMAATPSPGLASDSEKVLTAISQSIIKLVNDAKINEKNVVFALPENYVYTRTVNFPPLTDTEIDSAIEWQIESYIPIPKKDAVYDHQIISRSEKSVEVFIVASAKRIVDKYTSVIQMANLAPIAVETELIALSRSVAVPNRRCLILDFGSSTLDIAIVLNKQVVFSRSIPTGGEALTRAIAQAIGVQPAQAEEYKRTYGLSGSQLEGKVKQAVAPLLGGILDELKKAISFWKSDHPDFPIETIIVSGGTSALPDLVSLLTEQLNIEVSVGDPLSNITKDPLTSKALASYAPFYSIAVGLAMREGE